MSGHSPNKTQNHQTPFVTNPQLQDISAPQSTLHQSHLLTEPLIPQQAKRSARGSTRQNAPEVMPASSPMCAGTSIARVRTLAKGAPKNPELQRAHAQRHSRIESESSYTPLQYAQFEKELKHHPDKSWTSDLLQSIQHGVALGYEGPRGKHETSYQHTHTPP